MTHTLDFARDHLLQHPIYNQINTRDRLIVFMEHHVFSVWDFMCLLKRLQITLTSTQIPWIPRKNTQYARFINEIVLGEESDEDGNGGYKSHFELYIEAMEEIGANTTPILQYLESLKAENDPIEALEESSIPTTAQVFVQETLSLALYGELHEVVAAFFYGREDLIPQMFDRLIKGIDPNTVSTRRLQYYLQRHIELDGDHHGPLAEKLLNHVIKGHPQKTEEANQIAIQSLQSRNQLWDGVLAVIQEKGI